MTAADPLHLEMVLQRRRFGVGMVSAREQVARQLAMDGVSVEDLHLFLAYFEDRGKRLDDWRAVAWAELRKVGQCSRIVRDLRASSDQAGRAERGLGLDHEMAGGERCQHGTPRGHHCEPCDPQPLLGDQLVSMRETMFEHLIRWMMSDVLAGKPHEDDTPQVADEKKARRRKIEEVLRRHLLAVGGDGKRIPEESEVSRDDRQMLANAVPSHILGRRIHPGQRFPGEPVQRRSGAAMKVENWVKQANRHSRELWKTGPMLGHVEMAKQRSEAETDATAQPADAGDAWRELTEGAF